MQTDHIDEILEGDGRRATGPVVQLIVVESLELQVKFLLQLLDLVRFDVLTKFGRPQNTAEILPRNLSEPLRIELPKKKEN